jgi:hypothetical protein
MRAAALILLALAGCQTCPAPKIVHVPVTTIVGVPEALTVPCDEVPVMGQTVEESVRLANARLASLKECNKRMGEIRSLGR